MGEWQPIAQPPPLKMKRLTEFAQMLAHRYNGEHGRSAVTLFSVGTTEPRAVPGAAVPSREDREPALYARLFRAAYTGIKKGDPNAIVAAGETSNQGINRPTGNPGRDSVAPATLRRLAEVAPRLPFAAWADHPYSPNFGLGPSQKVRFPTVSFSTINRFGASLRRWFHRRIPIWITEYGEETVPRSQRGHSARQAADAREALRLAQTNRYVRMFIWFVFRDSNSTTWFSGLERPSGRKKPAYAAFLRPRGRSPARPTRQAVSGVSRCRCPSRGSPITYRRGPGSTSATPSPGTGGSCRVAGSARRCCATRTMFTPAFGARRRAQIHAHRHRA
jgi:hypothetical protein